MKNILLISALFLSLGLCAQEEATTDTVDGFLKKHNIKLNRKDVGDLVDDLEEAAD